jgi:transcriptional regulator of met regulon
VTPLLSPLLASVLTAIVTIHVTNSQRDADNKRQQIEADRADLQHKLDAERTERQRVLEARHRAYSRLNGLKILYASATEEQWIRSLDVSGALADWNLTPTKEIKDEHSKLVELSSAVAEKRADIGREVFEVLADVSENFDDIDGLQKAIDAFYEGEAEPFIFAYKGQPMPKSHDEVIKFEYAQKARIEARAMNSITKPLNTILALMWAQINAHHSQ